MKKILQFILLILLLALSFAEEKLQGTGRSFEQSIPFRVGKGIWRKADGVWPRDRISRNPWRWILP